MAHSSPIVLLPLPFQGIKYNQKLLRCPHFAIATSCQVQCNIDHGVFQPFCQTLFQSHDPDPFHRSLGDLLALSLLCKNGKQHSKVGKLSFVLLSLCYLYPVLESALSPHLSLCQLYSLLQFFGVRGGDMRQQWKYMIIRGPS